MLKEKRKRVITKNKISRNCFSDVFWSPPWAVFLLCSAWLKIRKWICLLPNGKLTKLVSSDCRKNRERGKNKGRWLELLPFWQRDCMNDTRKASWKSNLKPKLKLFEWGEVEQVNPLWCHGLSVNEWPLDLLPGKSPERGSILNPWTITWALCVAACFWSKFQHWTRSWINKLLPVCLLEKIIPTLITCQPDIS